MKINLCFKNICFYLLVNFLTIGFIEADETSLPKKYKLALCAIFKNEARYLKEWIEYHKLVGVEHFYLYNNKSKDRYFEILEPYIKRGIVTLIHWPDNLGYLKEENMFLWAISTQMPAFEHAIQFKAKKEAEWLVCMDINEFLVPPTTDNLLEILEKYDDYPAITYRTDYYDAYKSQHFPSKKLIIETTELISPPYLNPAKGVAKMIFKPEFCRGFTWAPYTPKFIAEKEPAQLRKPEMRLNFYSNRNAGLFYFGKTRLQIDNRTLSDEEITQLLDLGYEIEEQDSPMQRFIPALLNTLSPN
ncbi:MAG TPA: glycosyltransferase family 92 protein [Gammaproteobacteria bacterium]|nr:glycosyltransferase family 92 protein [Gammaproteobacteria bacterium]